MLSATQSATQMTVSRYLPGGPVDTRFGTNGTATTSFDDVGSSAVGANALVIQRDGRIVAAGYGNGALALARYMP